MGGLKKEAEWSVHSPPDNKTLPSPFCKGGSPRAGIPSPPLIPGLVQPPPPVSGSIPLNYRRCRKDPGTAAGGGYLYPGWNRGELDGASQRQCEQGEAAARFHRLGCAGAGFGGDLQRGVSFLPWMLQGPEGACPARGAPGGGRASPEGRARRDAAMATAVSSTPGGSGRALSRSAAFSPLSPTRLSRLQEKEELQQLNDRLAAYIDRVRALEADKSTLQLRLAEQEEGSSRELANLRLRYETELADARKAVDGIAIERATLQVELGKLSEEHRQLHTRNSKKEADLNLAQAHMRDLNAQLNSKEADLATALSGKRSLEGDLQDLKDQIVTLKLALEDTKKHLHGEMLRRVDLENQMKTMQEQMTFQKRLHEDELKETKRSHEIRIAEIESGRQKEFESKLSDALQGLRKEHEEQIQEYKDDLERTFSAKMENAQLSAAKNSDFANAAREELMETKMRVDTLTSQLNHYQSQNCALENRIRELQETLDYDRETHRRHMAEKDKEMAQTRRQMQAQLEEYEHLLDVKLALDLEINAYRKMLEGEEQRLKLSSSPSSQSVATQAATSHGHRFLHGKKRKLKESKKGEHSVSFKIVQHSSCSGNVSIEEIDTEGNFVKLKNNSDEDQSLNGWVLRRQLGSLSEITYKFPARFVLQAGQVVTIWGADAGVNQSPSDLVWKSQQSWGTGDNIGVTLINADGEETAERKIIHVSRGEGGELEDEFDEEEITGSEMEFHRRTKRRKKKCCLVS